MGYSLELFDEYVDKELICEICKNVIEKPLNAETCGHLFCEECILNWLKVNSICPIDYQPLAHSMLVSPSKMIIKLLENLQIKCKFHSLGCLFKFNLAALNKHLETCIYNSLNNIETKNFQNLYKDNLFKITHNLNNQILCFEQKLMNFKLKFNEEIDISTLFQTKLSKINRKYLQINDKFEKISQPILSLLKNNQITYEPKVQELNTKHEDNFKLDKLVLETNSNLNSILSFILNNKKTCIVYIRNLNEFLNAKVLEEFLRQNQIFTYSCELLNTGYQQSRDFKVIICSKNFDQLFNENIWPIGVTVNLIEFNFDFSLLNQVEDLNESDKQFIKTKLNEFKNTINKNQNLIIFGKRKSDLPCLYITSGFISYRS